MKKNDHLVDLLAELQVLDRVPRMGYTLRGVSDPESVAEHTFHVAFLVWALAERVEGLDTLRALELALLHDLAEVRTGDLPMTAKRYLPDGAKPSAEAVAFAELLAPIGERCAPLLAELAEGSSLEARFVKACDKLQLMLKVSVYEHWGAGGLAEFWDNEANFPDAGIEPVRELFEEIRRRRNRSAPD